jgi:hypothetical protein
LQDAAHRLEKDPFVPLGENEAHTRFAGVLRFAIVAKQRREQVGVSRAKREQVAVEELRIEGKLGVRAEQFDASDFCKLSAKRLNCRR